MWSQSGSQFRHYEKDNDVEYLAPGIYSLEYGAFGSMYLNRKQDAFDFPYKLYGKDGFPERVMKTYRASTSNVGVMLCGLKGTGKTVQAEQICNHSNLPVILVSKDFDKGQDLIYFLSYVNQEVVVMIDEYEKLFGKSDALLSIMDGTLNGTNRRLFVLTANTPNISESMLDRPSRIYYLKKFGNLDIGVIGEVVDDMLECKEYREEVVNYIGALEIITIDIVKTVIKEVNLFQEPPEKFKDILNVTVYNHARWDLLDEAGEPVITWAKSDLLDPFQKGYELRLMEFGHHWNAYGEIKAANKKTGKIVTGEGNYTLRKAKSFSTVISSNTTNFSAAAAE